MFLQNTTYKNKMEEILEKKKLLLCNFTIHCILCFTCNVMQYSEAFKTYILDNKPYMFTES